MSRKIVVAALAAALLVIGGAVAWGAREPAVRPEQVARATALPTVPRAERSGTPSPVRTDRPRRVRRSESPGPDPLASRPVEAASYCAGIRSLAAFSRRDAEPEGLTGEALAERFEGILRRYRALARQAPGAASARAWATLADGTADAVNVLRASGNDLGSQTVMARLIDLAVLTRDELPRAVADLPGSCGLDPGEIGLA